MQTILGTLLRACVGREVIVDPPPVGGATGVYQLQASKDRNGPLYSFVTVVLRTEPSSLHTAIGSPTLTVPLKILPIASRPR